MLNTHACFHIKLDSMRINLTRLLIYSIADLFNVYSIELYKLFIQLNCMKLSWIRFWFQVHFNPQSDGKLGARSACSSSRHK